MTPAPTSLGPVTTSAWYLHDDNDGYSRWFTEGITEDRQTVITESAKWMFADPSPENVAWVAGMSNLTSGTVASVLSATGLYRACSADVVALEGAMPLPYVVRGDWQAPAEAWIKADTPIAQAAYLGKHLMFWERPDSTALSMPAGAHASDHMFDLDGKLRPVTSPHFSRSRESTD